MGHDRILTLCYCLLWCITLYRYHLKVKSLNAAYFILFTYVLYAFFSFMTYGTNYPYFNPKPLKIFPFIYLYLALMIGVYPIMKYGMVKRVTIRASSLRVINIICSIFIVSTLIHLPSILSNLSTGLVRLLVDSSNAADFYRDSLAMTEDSGKSISNIAAIISNAFTGVGFFFTAYYLTIQNKSKVILIGLILSCLVKMTSGIAEGTRGDIVEYLFIAIASVLLFYGMMSIQIKRYIKIVGVSVSLLLAVPMVLITVGRFGTDNIDPLESIYYYAGIENINFNNYALDDNGIRYGDRTIPLFKRIVGFDNVPRNFFERRAKYPNLYLNDESFSTYVGDFAIDYGPALGLIIIIIISLTVYNKSKIRGDTIYLHQLLILHILLYMCTIGGLKLFPFADAAGLQVIVYAIIYKILKISTSKVVKI